MSGERVEKGSFLQLFTNKAFARLYVAQLTAQTGRIVGVTAFFFYLLEHMAEQPMYATITELMYSLPTLTVFFLVGVVADRLDRQRIAAVSNWIRAVLTLGIIGSAVWLEWMPLTFALLFVRSAVGQFFEPAQAGLVQGVLSKEEQTTAVGLNQMTWSFFALFGSGLGAACYWQFGLEGALLIDAAAFVLSGVFIRIGFVPEEARLPNGVTKWKEVRFGMFWADLKEGSRYIRDHELLMALMKGLLLFGALNGTLTVAPAFVMRYQLAPETFQEMQVLMSAAFGAGMLIGSPVASRLVKKWTLHGMIIWSCVASGLLLVGLGLVRDAWVFVGLYGVFGFLLPLINIPFFGWRNQIVERRMMGRVMGWHAPLLMISHSVTLGLISIGFPKWVSAEQLFFVIGGVMVANGLYYGVVLPRLAAREKEKGKEGGGVVGAAV